METQRVIQSFQIKGVRDGLLVTLDDHPDVDPRDQLHAGLAEKHAFLAGARIALDVGHRHLGTDEITDLLEVFSQYDLTVWAILTSNTWTRDAAREIGLATRIAGTSTDLEGNDLPGIIVDDADASPEHVLPSPTALLVQETLRSGRSVYYEGDIVVLGDVNPGAEVVAGGHVVVWGRLRGLVHAGVHGDSSAMICALDLAPTQLRIADQIAVDPDHGQQAPVPEQAMIRDGQIIAEPWPVSLR
ncbi:MAG: septum site-determining protein MinC [Chloroflexota bacterium]